MRVQGVDGVRIAVAPAVLRNEANRGLSHRMKRVTVKDHLVVQVSGQCACRDEVRRKREVTEGSESARVGGCARLSPRLRAVVRRGSGET